MGTHPIGLINAPGEFQWLMEDCLHSFRDDICTPYLDDGIVFSKSFQDYVDHVRQVLQRLLTNGIKLKPEKCKLFQKEVNYLGQIVTSDGYRPDPSKINAVTALKHSISANVGEVRNCLDYKDRLLVFPKRQVRLINLIKLDLYHHKNKVYGGKNVKITLRNY